MWEFIAFHRRRGISYFPRTHHLGAVLISALVLCFGASGASAQDASRDDPAAGAQGSSDNTGASQMPPAPGSSSIPGRRLPKRDEQDGSPDAPTAEKEDYTPAELLEMQAVYSNCSTSISAIYYDCKCMAMKFIDRRAAEDEDAPRAQRGLLLNKIAKECPNEPAIAGDAFQSCMEWAPLMRRDYRSFCECYANQYAKNFGKHPSEHSAQIRAMMTHAMRKCDFGGTD